EAGALHAARASERVHEEEAAERVRQTPAAARRRDRDRALDACERRVEREQLDDALEIVAGEDDVVIEKRHDVAGGGANAEIPLACQPGCRRHVAKAAEPLAE